LESLGLGLRLGLGLGLELGLGNDNKHYARIRTYPRRKARIRRADTRLSVVIELTEDTDDVHIIRAYSMNVVIVFNELHYNRQACMRANTCLSVRICAYPRVSAALRSALSVNSRLGLRFVLVQLLLAVNYMWRDGGMNTSECSLVMIINASRVYSK